MYLKRLLPVLFLPLSLAITGINACGDTGGPPAIPDYDRKVDQHALVVDVSTLTTVQTITFASVPEDSGFTFDADGLEDLVVYDSGQHELNLVYNGEGKVDIGVPAGESVLTAEYSFPKRPVSFFSGFFETDTMAGTWLWYSEYGYLYLCRAEHPRNGSKFKLTVTGVPPEMTAVYPSEIPSDAPGYQIAFVYGAFTEHTIGTTSAGTVVKMWSLPGFEADALKGSANLVGYHNFYETTFDRYIFGRVVGGKTVDWNANATTEYGGMEHHPFFDIEQYSVDNDMYWAHEDAHGWAGDGIARLASSVCLSRYRRYSSDCRKTPKRHLSIISG